MLASLSQVHPVLILGATVFDVLLFPCRFDPDVTSFDLRVCFHALHPYKSQF